MLDICELLENICSIIKLVIVVMVVEQQCDNSLQHNVITNTRSR